MLFWFSYTRHFICSAFLKHILLKIPDVQLQTQQKQLGGGVVEKPEYLHGGRV